jgi:hypothetical protein
MKRLQTFDAVIEELDGLAQAARLIGRGMPQLCYWRKNYRRFPARFYPIIRDELAERRCEVSEEVFDFEERKKAHAA